MSAMTSVTSVTEIPGVTRIEHLTQPVALAKMREMTQEEWKHEQIFGQYCSLSDHIDAPPREVYEYLADTRSLAEWTLTMRNCAETDEPGLWVADELLMSGTRIYTRTVANPDAMTVDYHCSWDQGRHLWMIYLMRVVDARLVLNRPGSVVLWTNCRHPFYAQNPWPELRPSPTREWVGEFWDQFYVGHTIELTNLKTICEYRHAHGEPITPDWSRVAI